MLTLSFLVTTIRQLWPFDIGLSGKLTTFATTMDSPSSGPTCGATGID